ncbi:prolyl oligopeptidase family serine peptidase [bacterium]|nr:prolyl oligopeptidase family serine peptidase [bacterium]
MPEKSLFDVNYVCKAIVLLAFFALQLQAQDLNLYQKQNFQIDKDVMPYRILYPDHFDKTKKYPLVLMLHGSGERGNDNELQLTHGAWLFVDKEVRKKYPAIVIFPQCPAEDYWSNVDRQSITDGKRNYVFREDGEPTPAMKMLIAFIDDFLKKPYVDQKRLYVGGLSMGGMGTFELLSRKPHLFAAAFPICGGGHPNTVKGFAKQVSLWVFHGAQDDVVPIHHSEVMVDALKKAGADVRFTVYPDVKHESWEKAFAEPDLLPWLFSNSLDSGKR